jgi:hypothetical protein
MDASKTQGSAGGSTRTTPTKTQVEAASEAVAMETRAVRAAMGKMSGLLDGLIKVFQGDPANKQAAALLPTMIDMVAELRGMRAEIRENTAAIRDEAQTNRDSVKALQDLTAAIKANPGLALGTAKK